jgi:serine/threonine protein kinase
LDDAERLAAKLDAWQAAQAGEGPLTPEDLCRDCPDLLPEIVRQVAVLRRFEALRVGEDEGTDEYRPAGADTSHDANPAGTSVPTTPRSIATPVVGGEFGGFRIVALLGEGGMGRVYRAEDPQLRREVALKVMKPAVAAKPESRGRFLREARAMAAVHHDNVAPIFQVSEVDGVPFLAMPLLRGESLAVRLKREGVLPTADVLHIGREAAAGLVAVHARGLIHRDIKPTNIWLETLPDDSGAARPRWRVKLLDFGLAREQSESDAVTQEGVVLGSPAYMSPEQTDGKSLDPRSDLFSLGSVLYECATGRRSFQEKTFTAILAAVGGHHPPPAYEVNPHVPQELSALIGRLQAKSPADRPPSAHSVAESIHVIEAGQQPGTRSEPPERLSSGPSRRRSRRFSVGCSVSVTIAAILMVSFVTLLCWPLLDQSELQRSLEPKPLFTHFYRGKALYEKGEREEAIKEFREALRLDPKDALAHTSLGVALYDKGQLDEAIKEYREAIRLDPKLAQAHGALGQALLAQGHYDEALVATRRCLELLPEPAPLRQTVLRRLGQCEWLVALERKLPAILEGKDNLADNAERLALAQMCFEHKKLYVASVRFYEDSFAADPKLAENPGNGYRYNAACAATLAGCGQGKDADKLDEKERARLRQRALEWLRADLALWAKQADSADPKSREAVQQQLKHWQTDADLAVVRGQDALAKLPAEEQEAWRKLWDDVAVVLKRASEPR